MERIQADHGGTHARLVRAASRRSTEGNDMPDLVSTKIRKLGIILLSIGGVVELTGLILMARFWIFIVNPIEPRTADEIGRAAAGPHVCVVLGVGFLIFGGVLFRKAGVLYRERGV